MTGRLLALLLMGLPLSVVAATPAAASCAEDSGPEGSAVIFVGQAVEERRGYTRFEVSEVWAGPDLAEEVWVLSGTEQPPWPLRWFSAVSSSVDASFEAGTTYVVGASEDFETSACSIGTVGSETAPGDPRAPRADGLDGADPPLSPVAEGIIAGGAALLLVGGLWALIRGLLGSRRRARSRRFATLTRPE